MEMFSFTFLKNVAIAATIGLASSVSGSVVQPEQNCNITAFPNTHIFPGSGGGRQITFNQWKLPRRTGEVGLGIEWSIRPGRNPEAWEVRFYVQYNGASGSQMIREGKIAYESLIVDGEDKKIMLEVMRDDPANPQIVLRINEPERVVQALLRAKSAFIQFHSVPPNRQTEKTKPLLNASIDVLYFQRVVAQLNARKWSCP